MAARGSGVGIAMLLAGAGGLFIVAGWQRSETDSAAEAAATAYVKDVAGRNGLLDVEVNSSVVRPTTALVRLTVRDGENHVRANVRLTRESDGWTGTSIDLPDLEGESRLEPRDELSNRR